MKSINPFSGALINDWPVLSVLEVNQRIQAANDFKSNRDHFPKKAAEMAKTLRQKKIQLAQMASQEMGKPISQSLLEIEKCAWCCEFYSENAEEFLKDRMIPTENAISLVRYEALGVWLAIMPWNFPFWQVIRCAIPCLAVGNKVVLKHASNVQGCAKALEEVFWEAGFAKEEFQNLSMSSNEVAAIIAHPFIKGVSFTGSEFAGREVASQAGRHLKPCILELGGSNAFIITPTADLDKAVEDVIMGRFQNNGQSCIAAKRLLVHASIYEETMQRLTQRISQLSLGDPMDDRTFIGPLAKPEFNELLLEQVKRSIEEGAHVECGGEVIDGVFQPTLLTHVSEEMICMQEELFGPVLPICSFETMEEAVRISNSTHFGLGVSIYGRNLQEWASHFQEGAVFFNSIVKSDPRMPFGGVKNSGFGRELGPEGLYSFTNIKTIVGQT